MKSLSLLPCSKCVKQVHYRATQKCCGDRSKEQLTVCECEARCLAQRGRLERTLGRYCDAAVYRQCGVGRRGPQANNSISQRLQLRTDAPQLGIHTPQLGMMLGVHAPQLSLQVQNLHTQEALVTVEDTQRMQLRQSYNVWNDCLMKLFLAKNTCQALLPQ